MATAGSGMVMHIVDSSLLASAAALEKVKPILHSIHGVGREQGHEHD